MTLTGLPSVVCKGEQPTYILQGCETIALPRDRGSGNVVGSETSNGTPDQIYVMDYGVMYNRNWPDLVVPAVA